MNVYTLNKMIFSIVLLATILPSGAQSGAASDWLSAAGDYQYQKPVICPVRKSRLHGYHICADQRVLVKKALVKAQSEGKLLIVKFGADWCPWCRKLHKIVPSKQVLGYQKDGFDYARKFAIVEVAMSTSAGGKGLVQLDSGAAVSNALLRQLDVNPEMVKGIPYLVVIDPAHAGKGIFRNTTDYETRFMGLFYHYKGVSYEPQTIRKMLKKVWHDLKASNQRPVDNH